jgi:hypothetical protein
MICGLANVFPEVLAKMYDAYLKGDRSQLWTCKGLFSGFVVLLKPALQCLFSMKFSVCAA